MTPRIHTIQHLRAVAALAVVAVHAAERVGDDLPAAIMGPLRLGHAGVDLFFVISGFIIWHRARGRGIADPRDFLIRRAIRVAPLYWIATLSWVGLIELAGFGWIQVTPDHVFRSLVFVPHENPSFPGHAWPVLVPGWTLNFEIFFYASVALAFLAPPGKRLVLLGCGLAGLVVIGLMRAPEAAWARTYTSPLLLEFLGGCLLAEIHARQRSGLAGSMLWIAGGLAVFAVSGPIVEPQDHLSRVIGYGLPALLIVRGTVGLAAVFPNWSRTSPLGDASYAVYLFHLFLIVPVHAMWVRFPEFHGPVTATAFVAICLVGSGCLGLAIHDRVERPLQNRILSLYKMGQRHFAGWPKMYRTRPLVRR